VCGPPWRLRRFHEFAAATFATDDSLRCGRRCAGRVPSWVDPSAASARTRGLTLVFSGRVDAAGNGTRLISHGAAVSSSDFQHFCRFFLKIEQKSSAKQPD
jgi:hypothetical protein